MSEAVFILQVHINPGINTFVDALYFTVTTLTTTGFGDITPAGQMGRGLTVVIMVVGVTLFLRVIHHVFKPYIKYVMCGNCSQHQHRHDAGYCDHCGGKLENR
jgi:voltage-gated potassium channel